MFGINMDCNMVGAGEGVGKIQNNINMLPSPFAVFLIVAGLVQTDPSEKLPSPPRDLSPSS